MNYRGQYLNGTRVVQSYTVGDATVLDAPEAIDYGQHAILIRTLNIGKSSRNMKLRFVLDSDAVHARVSVDDLKSANGNGLQVLTIPASASPLNLRIAMNKGIATAHIIK